MFSMLSERGSKLVVYEGFKYSKGDKTQKGQKWRCSRRKGCSAHLFTDDSGDVILSTVGAHNHDPCENLSRQFISNSVKRKASDSLLEPPAKLIRREIASAPAPLAENICRDDVNRVRRNLTCSKRKHLPPLAKCAADVHEALDSIPINTDRGNSALIGLSPDVLFRTKRICEDHFRQEDILPSGRLSNGAMPIQYIPPKSRESPPLLLTKAGLASSSPRNYSRKPSSTTSSASFPPEAIQTIIKEEYDVDEDNNSDNFPTNNELPVQENYSAIEPEFTEDPLTIKNSNILLDESESYSSNAIGQNLCEVTSLGKPQKVNRDSIKDDYSNLLRTDTVTEFQNHPNSKLEEKLRIEYIKFKIKNEEDISNLKKEAFRLQVHKEKMEIQFLQEAHEQKMKNLKLEYELLQSQLQKTKL
uniref:FLYWCH-type domain-containing protein n=2 Tax=Clastoptera arizonana TaxID=38151 RepID=A0A1B6CJ52_9HEMI